MPFQHGNAALARARNLLALSQRGRCAVGVSNDLSIEGRPIRLDEKAARLYAIVGDPAAVTSKLADRLEHFRMQAGDTAVRRILQEGHYARLLQDVAGQMAGLGQAIVVTLADLKPAGEFVGRRKRLGKLMRFEPRVNDLGPLSTGRYPVPFGVHSAAKINVDLEALRLGYHPEERQPLSQRNYRTTSHRNEFGNDSAPRTHSLSRTGEAYRLDHLQKQRPAALSRPIRDQRGVRYFDCVQLSVRSFDFRDVGRGDFNAVAYHWALAIDAQREESEGMVMTTFNSRLYESVSRAVGVEEAIDDGLINGLGRGN